MWGGGGASQNYTCFVLINMVYGTFYRMHKWNGPTANDMFEQKAKNKRLNAILFRKILTYQIRRYWKCYEGCS